MNVSDTLPGPLFRYPPFALFWAARVASALGYQMNAVLIGWLVYDRTHSALALGLVGLVQFLPIVLLTLVAGTVADRYNRRLVARICQTCQALVALSLAIISVESSSAWPIFVAAAGIGALRSFEQPTVSALLPELLPAEMLPRALAMVSSAFQTASIIGPALGGALYIVGTGVAFLVVALFYLGAVLCLSFVRHRHPARPREKVSVRTLLSGFTFVWQRKVLLGAISLDLFAVLLGGATALLPIYARDILHVGPIGLGLLRTAPAVGALLTSFYLARHPLGGRTGHIMFAAVTGFGLGTMVFGLSTWFPLSLAALAAMGACDVISVVIRSTLVQLGTPNEMRGRVGAVNSLFIGTSNQLGEFESGVTAALFGTVPAVLLGGLGTVLVAMLWMGIFPALRRVDRLLGEAA